MRRFGGRALHRRVAGLRWPRSLKGKVLLLSLFGVLSPVLGLVLFQILFGIGSRNALLLLGVVLTLGVIGATLTLYLQSALLDPIHITSQRLRRYIEEGVPPEMPEDYPGEIGSVMANIQVIADRLDNLEQLEQLLLRVLSHDLRSPIASVQMANQILKEEIDGGRPSVEVLSQMVRVIDHATVFQQAMVENLLLVSQIDSAVPRLEVEIRRLGELLDSVTTGMDLAAEQKGISLETHASEHVRNLMLKTDTTKLKQILVNLVSNAIKFTPGGGKVELGARFDENGLTLYVADTGIGISAEQQQYLYQAFSKAHRPGTEKEKGIGLGLWVSRTYAELLGGALDFVSKPGEGTRFELRFSSTVLADDGSAAS